MLLEKCDSNSYLTFLLLDAIAIFSLHFGIAFKTNVLNLGCNNIVVADSSVPIFWTVHTWPKQN